jgi:predicted nucleic acid-binding protein
MHFLDTSAIIEIFNATDKGANLKNYLKDDSLAISSITVHELLVGLKENEKEFINNFLRDVRIFNFDFSSAEESSKIENELKKKGKLINIMDILVSGILRKNKLKLVTCDKDFLNVNNLEVKIF